MEQVNIILENGIQKVVDSIFYLYNSKYYFVYTEKELDENNYVIFYLVEVGKEIKNTATGSLDTGYMVGIEVNDNKIKQDSITKLVEYIKSGNTNSEIKYLPMSMLSTLKIMTKNTFRLKKEVVKENFKLDIPVDDLNPNGISVLNQAQPAENSSITETELNLSNEVSTIPESAINENSSILGVPVQNDLENKTLGILSLDITPNLESISPNLENNDPITSGDVIIDYRSKFFEEQEKNKELQLKIEELTQKLETIKNIII